MRFEVVVELKPEVLDTQGRAISDSIARAGVKALKSVGVSKRFVIEVDAQADQGLKTAQAIAKSYLANPVSEVFHIRQL